ncbi:sigma-70 region 4 domain-containing protein [Paraburkholderia sp.]|uniref:sigma-70 region 4 domain-containing protein n=1 Tax=Paraburkholderia sp. TaxID=1926495 RepID=UPI00238A19F7|nr:sigma-70 region 4 domain-containing protein [Paraburkholderia sp.]MDE1179476.1 sigma-70 region 4 domain-containing protein [Paraburkholderia sp.]
MPQPPKTRDAITLVLKEMGPMTAEEIAQELGMKLKTVQSAICIARKKPQKYFYIVDFVFTPGLNGVPAIYAAGNKRDALRMTRRERSKERYERNRPTRELMHQVMPGNPFGVLIAQVTQ